MNQLDVYYRALIDYRAQTLARRECIAQRGAVTKVNTESDRITVTRMLCTIDEDWVNAIEAGLVHIEKAIKEERQFIRSNGEVVPIEKVKHVSKDSVEHLSKHSNLIAREIEGEDIIPDHLYTVERLSDYAVYENRFLYMLLCYLRDFITLRYNKILESTNTYDANMTMNKEIKINKRSISYQVNLAEIRKDDEYLRDHNEAKEMIDRIDLLLKAVIAFLSTPLMEYASKAPMLRPPITKTNVLKMNNNFKGAMALYEYVTAYDKPGYTIETKVIELNPFREQIADEFAETVLLSSFLTYEYGLDIRDELQKSYEEEEKRRKEEEYQLFLEKLEKARRRVQKAEMSPEEYILMLERQIRFLEDKCAALDAALAEIKRLKAELEAAYGRIAELEALIEELRAELAYQIQKYIEDMAALKAAHAEEIRLLNEAHAIEVERLNEEIRQTIEKYEAEISRIRLEHAEEIRKLHEAYAAEIDRINEEHAREIESIHEAHAEEIRKLHETYADEIRKLHESYVEEINGINEAHAEEIRQINEAHASEVAELNDEISRLNEEIGHINEEHATELKKLNVKMDEERRAHLDERKRILEECNRNIKTAEDKHQSEKVSFNSTIREKQLMIDNLIAERDSMIKERRIMAAELYALRVKCGVKASEDDLTSKENFDELEREFNVFKSFYKEQWNKTKKRIKKEVMQTIHEKPPKVKK